MSLKDRNRYPDVGMDYAYTDGVKGSCNTGCMFIIAGRFALVGFFCIEVLSAGLLFCEGDVSWREEVVPIVS
jgi:hypothetical protein